MNENLKKAMISQPMAGKSKEEIIATREKAIKTLKEKGFEVINTLFTIFCGKANHFNGWMKAGVLKLCFSK